MPEDCDVRAEAHPRAADGEDEELGDELCGVVSGGYYGGVVGWVLEDGKRRDGVGDGGWVEEEGGGGRKSERDAPRRWRPSDSGSRRTGSCRGGGSPRARRGPTRAPCSRACPGRRSWRPPSAPRGTASRPLLIARCGGSGVNVNVRLRRREKGEGGRGTHRGRSWSRSWGRNSCPRRSRARCTSTMCRGAPRNLHAALSPACAPHHTANERARTHRGTCAPRRAGTPPGRASPDPPWSRTGSWHPSC